MIGIISMIFFIVAFIILRIRVNFQLDLLHRQWMNLAFRMEEVKKKLKGGV